MKSIAKTFLFFFQNYTKSTFVVVLLLILAGIAEAFGVAAFLPFLQIFLEGKETIDHIPYAPVDELLKHYGIALNFITVGLFIIAMITAKAAILWLAMWKVSRTVAVISTDFRSRFLRSLLHADWRFFTAHPLGKSLNAIATETFRGSLTFVSMTRFLAYVIQFSVYLTSAFILSWRVSLSIIAVGVAIALVLWVFVRMARRAGTQQTEAIKTMLTHMGDILQGIKPMRSMALEEKFIDLLHTHSRELQEAQVNQLLSTQSLRIFHEPLMAISTVMGLYVAMTLGALEDSALALMMILFIRIMTGLNSAQSEYQRLSREESALWSLLDTIDETEKAAERGGGHDLPPETIETVTFDDVRFSHGKKQILKNAAMTFRRRELSVLIGESGSGKTTVLDLLSAFYRPDEGRILIDGQPLDRFELKSWRRKIGFVPQEVFLFNDSIINNIVMGRKGISEQDVWKALEAVGAKDFVAALPDGLHASVGENGRKLSGGQRQRISIARAIVGRPQILLLDEATSALDKETEQVLLRTLKNLAKSMTVILVTHNPAAIEYADTVYEI